MRRKPLVPMPLGWPLLVSSLLLLLACSVAEDSSSASDSFAGGATRAGMATTAGTSGGGVFTGGTPGAGGTSSGSATAAGRSNTAGVAGSDCSLADAVAVDLLPALTFDRYHSQAEMETYLGSIASNMPMLAKYQVLGQSVQGRNLSYLVINATCQPSPPAVLAIGTHHGDEKSTTEAVLSLPDYLLRASTTETSVRHLLARYAFYLLPMMNPDGYAANTRVNADGADLNRDYSYPERSDANSFVEKETQLVKTLQDAVQFHAAIAYHSGALEVVWPWCYTTQLPADDAFFTAAGMQAAQAMNMAIFQQSANDYVSQGEYIDYAYFKHGTFAATFEISSTKTPSAADLAGVVGDARKGTLAWVQAVSAHDSGTLHMPPQLQSARQVFPRQTPFNDRGRLE
jgi:hypothetical protein